MSFQALSIGESDFSCATGTDCQTDFHVHVQPELCNISRIKRHDTNVPRGNSKTFSRNLIFTQLFDQCSVLKNAMMISIRTMKYWKA